jgi:uncharacterized membrane protein
VSSDFTLLLILALLIVNAWAMRRNARLMAALKTLEARIAKLEGLAAPPAPAAEALVAPTPTTLPVLPAPIQPRPKPAPKPARPSLFARIEKSLASRWFVWIGGALILLAGALIVRSAIDEGWFGPPLQLALVYGLGFMLLAASEFVRRRPEIAGLPQWRGTPATLAIGGLSAMFAATHAGIATLGLLGPPAAFVLFALIALAAILLSLRLGPWLALFGLGAGYLAPILVRFEHPAAAALFGYILAMTAAATGIVKRSGRHGFIWLIYGAALIWALSWIDTPRGASDSGEAAFYAVGLCALAAMFAWNDARDATQLKALWRGRLREQEALAAAYVLTLAVGILLLALFDNAYGPLTIAAIVCFCALAVLAAVLREGFAVAALGAAVVGVLMLWGWPASAPLAEPSRQLPVNVSAMIRAAGALGFVFSAGGWLMMARSQRGGAGAALAALGPIAIVFAAQHSAGGLRLPILWAAAAMVLAMLNAFALERIAKRVGGVDRAPDVSAAFALGSAAALIAAVYFALERTGLWLSLAFAVLIPAIVWLDRRLSLPALRIAAGILGFLVAWRLTLGFEPLLFPPARLAIFNELLAGYGGGIAALWGAAWLYRRDGAAPRVAGWLESCALIAGMAALFWESRHLANAGDVRLTSGAVGEAGGLATALAVVALLLAWRFGAKPRRTIFWGETAYVALAAILALLVNGLLLNPWLGEAPAPAPGWPILNLLLLGYGAPAAVLAGYAILKRRHGAVRRAALAGAAACLLAFLNVTLEVRRLFHGAEMTQGPLTPLEAWSYTAAWIVFAGALLALGLLRHRPTLRYASLAVLLAALFKAFLFDLSALTGVLRALSYFGLGAAIIATALIYQRFVFPRAPQRAEP